MSGAAAAARRRGPAGRRRRGAGLRAQRGRHPSRGRVGPAGRGGPGRRRRGDYTRERLEPYRERLRAPLGPRTPRAWPPPAAGARPRWARGSRRALVRAARRDRPLVPARRATRSVPRRAQKARRRVAAHGRGGNPPGLECRPRRLLPPWPFARRSNHRVEGRIDEAPDGRVPAADDRVHRRTGHRDQAGGRHQEGGPAATELGPRGRAEAEGLGQGGSRPLRSWRRCRRVTTTSEWSWSRCTWRRGWIRTPRVRTATRRSTSPPARWPRAPVSASSWTRS